MFISIIFINFLLGSFVYRRYKSSINKDLFLKTGLFKGTIALIITCIVGYAIASVIKIDQTISIDSFQLTSGLTYPYTTNFWVIAFQDFIRVFTELNLIDLLTGLLSVSFCLLLLWKIFQPNRNILLNISLIIYGMIIPFLAVPVSVQIKSATQNELTGTFIGELIYWVFNYGFLSETLKILPGFLLLFIAKKNAPDRLIFLTCLISLGFAFSENLYRVKGETDFLLFWAICFSFLHMIQSSIALYGTLQYFFRRNFEWGYCITFFLLSIGLAGINNLLYQEGGLAILILLLLIPQLTMWMIILNNVCSNSKSYMIRVRSELTNSEFLILAGAGVMIAATVLINFYLVPNYDTNQFSTIAPGLTFVFFILVLISFRQITPVPGFWRNIKFHSDREERRFVPSFLFQNLISPVNLVDKKLRLSCPHNNHYLADFFSNDYGVVKKRLLIDSDGQMDTEWYLVKLRNPLDIVEEFDKHHVVIKMKSYFSDPDHDKKVPCHFKLVYFKTDLNKKSFSSADFYSYGGITISGLMKNAKKRVNH